MIKLSLPKNRHKRRFFGSILTCLIFLTTCTFFIVFMINMLADRGETATKLDRMAVGQKGTPSIQAKGIQNTGNICYASSVTQMLYRIVGIHDFILNVDDNNLNLPVHETRPILGLKYLFKNLDSPQADPVRGHSGNFIPSQFPPNEPGDSEEFYTAWMGLLEKLMGEGLRDELFLKVALNRTTTSKINQQSIISTDYWSNIKVTFPEISIAQSRPLLLEELLAHQQGPFGEEILTSQMRQIYRISTLPKTLAVSFVRTAYHPKKGLVKINTPVQIPEILNLSPFMNTPQSVAKCQDSTNFRLKMFVLHKGNAVDGGHYVAYVQDTPDQWQIIDDENVRNVPKSEALEYVKFAAICFFDKI